MINSQPYIIRFLSKQGLTKDIYTFYFTKPKGFNYSAGQYNRWTLPIKATDGRGSSRFFTISSSPTEKDKISLTTKIIQSDFKKALLKLIPNEEVKIFGPMGNFILDDTDTKPKVFLAGGIGITTFYNMICYATNKKLNTSLTLLVSFSTPDEMIYFEELKKLEEQHTNIKIAYTISKPEKSKTRWNGDLGRISNELINKYVPDISNVLFYIVGSPTMEEKTKMLLKQMGIAEGNILTEQFTGY